MVVKLKLDSVLVFSSPCPLLVLVFISCSVLLLTLLSVHCPLTVTTMLHVYIYIHIFGSTVIEMHVFTISFHPLSSLCLSPLMFVQVFV